MSPRPIVLSVQPKHANNILSRSKVWEFRKYPLGTGTTVLMHRSGPATQRGLVAAWRVGDVLSGSAVQHHAEVGEKGGVSLDELIGYAGDHQRNIWRHQITDLGPFPEAFTLGQLYRSAFDSAPQSWRYAPGDWAERLGLKAVPA